MNTWIDIYDGLPEDEQTVLIAWYPLKGRCPYPHFYALGSYYEGQWLTNVTEPYEVLAWMPLPPPYTEG